MKLGQKAMEALRAEITGELKAGDDLVVAGRYRPVRDSSDHRKGKRNP